MLRWETIGYSRGAEMSLREWGYPRVNHSVPGLGLAGTFPHQTDIQFVVITHARSSGFGLKK